MRHKIAREGAKVGKLRGVVRRDDEAEMMPVALAALGEGASVRGVARRVEHFSGGAIASDAIAA